MSQEEFEDENNKIYQINVDYFTIWEMLQQVKENQDRIYLCGMGRK